jgi:hypothetical protein
MKIFLDITRTVAMLGGLWQVWLGKPEWAAVFLGLAIMAALDRKDIL